MRNTIIALTILLTASAATDPGLTGHWSSGRIWSTQYHDGRTGAPAPTNGNSFFWDFRSDGTYSFTGLMQSVLYQCTTTMFSNETGTYTVQSGTVKLEPQKNPYKMTNSCAPSSNREAPGKLVRRAYRFRVVRDDANRRLELTGEDGAVQTFSSAN